MSKEEGLRVGLKLLGVYFVGLGLVYLGDCIGRLPGCFFRTSTGCGCRGSDFSAMLVSWITSLLHPALECLVGYVLLARTDWCLGKVERATQSGAPASGEDR